MFLFFFWRVHAAMIHVSLWANGEKSLGIAGGLALIGALTIGPSVS